jgi:hypothetical protein
MGFSEGAIQWSRCRKRLLSAGRNRLKTGPPRTGVAAARPNLLGNSRSRTTCGWSQVLVSNCDFATIMVHFWQVGGSGVCGMCGLPTTPMGVEYDSFFNTDDKLLDCSALTCSSLVSSCITWSHPCWRVGLVRKGRSKTVSGYQKQECRGEQGSAWQNEAPPFVDSQMARMLVG